MSPVARHRAARHPSGPAHLDSPLTPLASDQPARLNCGAHCVQRLTMCAPEDPSGATRSDVDDIGVIGYRTPAQIRQVGAHYQRNLRESGSPADPRSAQHAAASMNIHTSQSGTENARARRMAGGLGGCFVARMVDALRAGGLSWPRPRAARARLVSQVSGMVFNGCWL